MTRLKIALTLLLPAVAAGLVLCSLFVGYRLFVAGYSHDVYESHRAIALLPFMAVIAFFIGYLPALFYVADLLHQPHQIEPETAAEPADTLTSAPALHVGQIITAATCKLRVKEIKLQHIFNALEIENELLFDYF